MGCEEGEGCEGEKCAVGILLWLMLKLHTHTSPFGRLTTIVPPESTERVGASFSYVLAFTVVASASVAVISAVVLPPPPPL